MFVLFFCLGVVFLLGCLGRFYLFLAGGMEARPDRWVHHRLSSSRGAACPRCEYWSVDKFHAHGHKKTCQWKPPRRLQRRTRPASEQVDLPGSETTCTRVFSMRAAHAATTSRFSSEAKMRKASVLPEQIHGQQEVQRQILRVQPEAS